MDGVMARDKDRFRGDHQDRRRLHTSKVREREEREEIRKVKFMAQPEKQHVPPAWQQHELIKKLRSDLIDASTRIDALEADAAAREHKSSQPDWTARLLGMFAVLLSAAAVGLWFVAVRN
jgi:hypothetical protein